MRAQEGHQGVMQDGNKTRQQGQPAACCQLPVCWSWRFPSSTAHPAGAANLNEKYVESVAKPAQYTAVLWRGGQTTTLGGRPFCNRCFENTKMLAL